MIHEPIDTESSMGTYKRMSVRDIPTPSRGFCPVTSLPAGNCVFPDRPFRAGKGNKEFLCVLRVLSAAGGSDKRSVKIPKAKPAIDQ